MVKKGIFDRVYDEIVSDLIEQGLSDEEIITFMVKQNLPQEIAWMLLSRGWFKKLLCKKNVIPTIVIENMVCMVSHYVFQRIICPSSSRSHSRYNDQNIW